MTLDSRIKRLEDELLPRSIPDGYYATAEAFETALRVAIDRGETRLQIGRGKWVAVADLVLL